MSVEDDYIQLNSTFRNVLILLAVLGYCFDRYRECAAKTTRQILHHTLRHTTQLAVAV